MAGKKQRVLGETFLDRLVAGNVVKLAFNLGFFLNGYKPRTKSSLKNYKELVRRLKKFVRAGETAEQAREKERQRVAKLPISRSELTQEAELRTSYPVDAEGKLRELEETKRKLKKWEEELLKNDRAISDGKEAKKCLARIGVKPPKTKKGM